MGFDTGDRNGIPRETPLTSNPIASSPIYGRHALHDPAQRPLHIIVVGAGPSGIAALIALKKLPCVTFQCLEKNSDVGGTWFETRYPGAACDVASHAYQYTFESKKDWTRHFAPAEEIGEYFKSVAKKYDLHQHILFDARAVAARWDDDSSKWHLQIATPAASSSAEPIITDHTADVFINAGGILNDWKWPDIDCLHSFKGRLLHTAAWDTSIDLEDKRVAVIGSGASSIQVVPTIQPSCRSLDVFVRSPTYILPTAGFGIESATYNESYTASQLQQFSDDGDYYRGFRKAIEQRMNENFAGSIKTSQAQTDGRKWAEDKMRAAIKSPELQDKLIPKWELGCRRITPGLPYLNAVQQPNVDVVREPIKKITEEGILTTEKLHQVDVLICATGFNTSFDRYEIVGRGGVTLTEKWKKHGPEAYLGTAVAGFPNYFTILGPNCPIANGSLIPCIESSIDYIVRAIQKMQTDQIRSIEVKQEMQDYFNEYTQSLHRDLVWSGSCVSWYKDRVTGRVTAVWPGSSIHFMEVIAEPRWEDFHITYMHPNPFMFLGNGVSQREARSEDLTYCKNHHFLSVAAALQAKLIIT